MNAYGKVRRALALLLLVSMLFGNNGILAYALDESGTADPSVEIVAETEELPDATTEQMIVTEQDQGNTTLAGAEQKGQQEVPGQGLPDQEQGLTTPVEGQPVLTDPELVSEQPTTSGEPPIAEQLPPDGNSVPTLQENLVPTQPVQTAITPAAVTPTRTHYDGTSYNTDIVAWADFESAEAISDSAVFAVTELDPDTGSYPYAAYAAALNAQGTTRFLDLAFLLGGEQTTECQPAVGSVRMTLVFPAGVLAAGTTVTHLPLREDVRAAVAKTADAVSITAEQIHPEEVRDLYVDTEKGLVSFTADSLSVFAITIPAAAQDEPEEEAIVPEVPVARFNLQAVPAANQESSHNDSLNGDDIEIVLDRGGSDRVSIAFKDANGNAVSISNKYYLYLTLNSSTGGEFHALKQVDGNAALGENGWSDLQKTGSGDVIDPASMTGETLKLELVVNKNSDADELQWGPYWNSVESNGKTLTVGSEVGDYVIRSIIYTTDYRENNEGDATKYHFDKTLTVTLGEKPAREVIVNLYDYDGTTPFAPQDLTGNYYIRVRAHDRETGAEYYAVKPITLNGQATASIQVKGFVTTDKGTNGGNTADEIPYNPDTMVIDDVRLISDANPFWDYETVMNAIDAVPGFSFMGNEEDGDTNTISLKRSYKKEYNIRLTFDPEKGTIPASDYYYVFVTVGHKTTEDTYFLKKLDISESSFADGKNYVDIPVPNWQDSNGNELDGKAGRKLDTYTGEEESITLQLLKANGEINVNNAVAGTGFAVISEGGNVKDYTVSYGTLTPEKDDAAHVDHAIHPITLKKVVATEDYSLAGILGPGMFYGINAEYFDKGGHDQTNYAVNYFANPEKIDSRPDLAANKSVSFVIANLIRNATPPTVRIGEATPGHSIVYINGTEEDVQDDSGKAIVIPSDGAVLSSTVVEPILNHGDRISAELASHPATITPDAPTAEKYVLDTTAFPDNATIYVDADKILDFIGKTGGLEIHKNDNQIIVFNFQTATSVSLQKFYCTVNGEVKESDSPEGAGDQNVAVDQIARHIVWNMPNAANVEINTSTGVFLIPRGDAPSGGDAAAAKANSDTQVTGTSSGWIISDGYVHNQGSAEWHNVFADMPDATDVYLRALKTLDGKTPAKEETFRFEFSRFVEKSDADKQTGMDTDGFAPKGEPVVNDGTQINYRVNELENGANVYRIREIRSDDGSIISDTKEYYVWVYLQSYQVVQNDTTKTIWVAGAPQYYESFDKASFDPSASTPTGVSDPVGQMPTFLNRTKEEECMETLTGQKTLVNNSGAEQPLTANQFSFSVSAAEAYGDAVDESTLNKTAGNAADGTIDFGSLTFKKAGTYVYTVQETTPSGNGITADPSVYTVTFTVAAGESGKLSVTKSITKGGAAAGAVEAIRFVNSIDYTAAGSVVLRASKVLNGKALEDGMFSFELKAADGTVLQTKTNAADGSVTFDALQYTQADLPNSPLTYTISELKGNAGGVSYDETPKTVTVTLTDNGDGTISATASPDAAQLVFTNEYKASGKITLGAYKVLNGRAMAPGEFSFELKDPNGKVLQTKQNDAKGNITFDEITYTQEDVVKSPITYKITEVKGNAGGITYDENVLEVEVALVDKGDGTITATASPDAAQLVFTNEYKASGKITLSALKVLNGRALAAGEFSFELKDAAGKVLQTKQNDAKGNVTFDEITYTQEDVAKSPITYKITEVKGNAGGITYDEKILEVEVTLVDNGDGTITATASPDAAKLVFTNEYKASGKITLGASKVLNGRAMAPGEFSFELKDATGKVLQTKQNDAKGNITFDEITYTQEDAVKGTITYTVSEVKGKAGGVTYDTNPQTVTVTLTDNGDGTITATADKTAFQVVFTNTYEASGKVKLGAKKELTGKKLTAGMFSFELRDADDKVLQTKENAADGSVSFDEMSYTLEDVAKSPITYKIAEAKGEAGGITYDETVREVTVTLVDNGDGTITATASPDTATLVFVNEYTASGKVALGATKVLNGRALKASEFSFELKDANGTVLQTKTNAADGSVSFDEISYTLGDLSQSPFTYTISEVKGSVNGVTYDESVQTVKVRLEDNGDGTITATPDKTTAQICFTNSYSGVGEIVLGAKKVLEGKTLEEGQFSFQLKNANGEVLQTKTNAADGSVSFDAIRYTSADLPKSPIAYTICEEKGNLPGVKYDETELTVKVTLTDKGDGTILAVADKTSQELTFTNTYTAAGEIVLEAKKTMNGREPKADEFSFELKSADGQVLQTKKNAADGSVKFDVIAYTLEDVAKSPITYTISEVKGQLPGVTYDETPKTVTVTLKDEGNGTITATATPAAVELVFTNSYDAKGEVTLKAKKVLNGRALEAGQFTLLLMDKSGKVIDRAQNAADGSVTFQTIEYTLADVKNSPIEYSVVEEIPAGAEQNKPLNGYLYDFRSYTVKVTLTDKGDGTIEASPDLNDEQLVFTNTYGADGSVQLDAVKTLEGEALRGGVFHFTLSTKDGELLQTKTNDADGKVSFDPITYSIDDVAQSPYVYLIRELDEKNEKYTYDDTEFEVSVALKDNGDGTITATPTRTSEQVEFVNTAYAEGDIVLGARKVLEGEPLREGQFSFELKDASGKVLQTKQNDARGAVTFDAITYTLEDLPKSPITYTVSEVASTNKRYTCDSTVYTVKVTLVDNDDGTITATADRTAGELVFVNKANARGGIVLRATKELKGAELQTGQFSFQLKDASGKVLQTKTNDTKGYVTFDPILYTLADVGKSPFTYTVNEVQGSTKGMTYDTTVYTVKVTLIDNGDDTITAKADKTDKQLHFVNSYKEIRAPKTGDSSTILPYVSLMLFAGFGMAWTGNTFRRKKNQD